MPEISYTRVNDNTPVLVGCAQLTDKRGVEGYNYLEILTEVSKKALIDCEASKDFRQEIDTVGVIRFVADTPQRDSATSDLWGYPNMPRSLAWSLAFNAKNEIKVIGTRHGEKLYETLCTREEMLKAEDMGDFYRIPADNRDLNYSRYFSEGETDISKIEDYHSHNTKQLTDEELKQTLLNLDFIKENL